MLGCIGIRDDVVDQTTLRPGGTDEATGHGRTLPSPLGVVRRIGGHREIGLSSVTRMQIVVGDQRRGGSEPDALAFAVLWARASALDPGRRARDAPALAPHGPGSVDAEWVAYLRSESAGTLDRARALVPDDVEARYVIGEHGGSGRGLASVAAAHDGRLVVIGSAPDARPGSIRLGSTATSCCTAPRARSPSSPRVSRGGRCQRSTGSAWRTPEPLTPTLRWSRHGSSSSGPSLPIRLVTLVQYRPRRFPGATQALDEIRADARLWLEQVRASVPEPKPRSRRVMTSLRRSVPSTGCRASPCWWARRPRSMSRVFLGATATRSSGRHRAGHRAPRGVDPASSWSRRTRSLLPRADRPRTGQAALRPRGSAGRSRRRPRCRRTRRRRPRPRRRTPRRTAPAGSA